MRRWTVVSATALLGGCALATATPPQVEIASVQLRGVGLLEQRLDVGLCAFNPNESELAFRRIDVGIGSVKNLGQVSCRSRVDQPG